MGDADSRMPSVREIFGSGEPDNEDHDPDAEDHESDARRSQSHGTFGSSDRLFVGDLVGGDYHGNFIKTRPANEGREKRQIYHKPGLTRGNSTKIPESANGPRRTPHGSRPA